MPRVNQFLFFQRLLKWIWKEKENTKGEFEFKSVESTNLRNFPSNYNSFIGFISTKIFNDNDIWTAVQILNVESAHGLIAIGRHICIYLKVVLSLINWTEKKNLMLHEEKNAPTPWKSYWSQQQIGNKHD